MLKNPDIEDMVPHEPDFSKGNQNSNNVDIMQDIDVSNYPANNIIRKLKTQIWKMVDTWIPNLKSNQR